MAIINVDDISIYKGGKWNSLKNQKVYSNGWRDMSDGSGVYKDGNWYVFESLPTYTVTYASNNYGTASMYYLDANHQAIEISNGAQVKSGTTLHVSGTSISGYFLSGVFRTSDNFYGYYPAGLYNGSLTPSISSNTGFEIAFSNYWGPDATVYDRPLHLVINEDTTHIFDNLSFQVTVGTQHGEDSATFNFQETQTIDLYAIANDTEGCWIGITLDNYDNLKTQFIMTYSYKSEPYEFSDSLDITSDDFVALHDGLINGLYFTSGGINGINGANLMMPLMGDTEGTLTLNIRRFI
jgi:hypothetical protein